MCLELFQKFVESKIAEVVDEQQLRFVLQRILLNQLLQIDPVLLLDLIWHDAVLRLIDNENRNLAENTVLHWFLYDLCQGNILSKIVRDIHLVGFKELLHRIDKLLRLVGVIVLGVKVKGPLQLLLEVLQSQLVLASLELRNLRDQVLVHLIDLQVVTALSLVDFVCFHIHSCKIFKT